MPVVTGLHCNSFYAHIQLLLIERVQKSFQLTKGCLYFRKYAYLDVFQLFFLIKFRKSKVQLLCNRVLFLQAGMTLE